MDYQSGIGATIFVRQHSNQGQCGIIHEFHAVKFTNDDTINSVYIIVAHKRNSKVFDGTLANACAHFFSSSFDRLIHLHSDRRQPHGIHIENLPP